MPEVMFTGPAGRLEGRYQHTKTESNRIALILHPHPQYGGTMNNRVVYEMFYAFQRKGFSVLRFNFRGAGRSQASSTPALGELADAASALDWLQSMNPTASECWIAGFSFGAWIGMQLLMRRPEIHGFISVSPPANMYDFTFLAPCPSSGLIVTGRNDMVAPEPDVAKLVQRLSAQRGIKITYTIIDEANHFFDDKVEPLIGEVEKYLDMRLANPEQR